jgi:hypothetical protein
MPPMGQRKIKEKKAKANTNVRFIGAEAQHTMPFSFILFGISFFTLKMAAMVPGIPGSDRLLAQRTLFLSSTQQICNQSKPQ